MYVYFHFAFFVNCVIPPGSPYRVTTYIIVKL